MKDMKNTILFAMTLLLAAFAAGCEEEEGLTLKISTETIDTGAEAGSYTVGVAANTRWAAEADADWCTLVNASLPGNGTLTVNLAENTNIEARTATITFATVPAGAEVRTITVTQRPSVIAVEPGAIHAPAAGASFTMTVTGRTSAMTWTASCGNAWSRVSGAGTGTGTFTVPVAPNPNPGEVRAATITVVAGTYTRRISVKQDSLPVELAVNPETIKPDLSAGTHTIGVSTNATWRAAVSAGATWCMLSSAAGTLSSSATFTAGAGILTVVTDGNPVVGVPRAATITVTAAGNTAGRMVQEIAVVQAATPLELTAAPDTVKAAYTAGTYAITGTSNTTWKVSASAVWCTPITGSKITGSGTVTIDLDENPDVTKRTALVILTAGAGSASVVVAQAARPIVTPQYAASTRTWTFGDNPEIWSDAIEYPSCKGADWLYWQTTVPYCTSLDTDGRTFYYYNWPYVNANAKELCPAPWRVPTRDDFAVVGDYTTKNEIVKIWGNYGLRGENFGMQDSGLFIWSSTPSSDEPDRAWAMMYPPDWTPPVPFTDPKYDGFQVRCVR
jgi:hypothetical protein